MSYNTKLIISNWKMNGNIKDAMIYFDKLSKKDFQNIVICPNYILLGLAKAYLENTQLDLGAQDLSSFAEASGAFTGDISASMLKDAGCNYVIIGHFERRSNYLENAETLKNKIKHAHSNGLKVILCVGENLEQKEKGEGLKVIENQIYDSLPLSSNDNNTIIAYEPVWAIGGFGSASIYDISTISEQINDFCRKKIEKSFKILYGGSVNQNNIQDILRVKTIDGVLVGSSSLKIEEFINLIENAQKL